MPRLPLCCVAACVVGLAGGIPRAHGQPAQEGVADRAIAHARADAHARGLDSATLGELVVAHAHRDPDLDLDYVYLQQRLDGIPVRGARASVALRGRSVVSYAHSLEPAADGLVGAVAPRSARPRIGDREALERAAAVFGIVPPAALAPRSGAVDGRRAYGTPAYARLPVTVEDYYLREASGRLRRCRGVQLALAGQSSDYLVSVDAVTGDVVEVVDRTNRCAFGHARPRARGGSRERTPRGATALTSRPPPPGGRDAESASYRVFAWPAESPSHGVHAFADDPADATASPFGWHDTDGEPGAEFTVTRGNNAHAYRDGRDEGQPSEGEPDGGPELRFDFGFADDREALDQSDAAIVNLFYGVNKVHDLAQRYGFTEEAGNYQETNYGGASGANDPVIAQAQDGGLLAESGSPPPDYLNNANFSTRGDGSPGVMQMYLWTTAASDTLVSAAGPDPLAGKRYGPTSAVAQGWGEGAYVDTVLAVRAPITRYDDGIAETSRADACEPPVDPDALAGRIVVIDRGTCQFGAKALRTQDAGAVGVVICNYDDDVLPMGAGEEGALVTVPVVMLTSTGCAELLLDLAEFPDLTLEIGRPERRGPQYRSSSFDNAIVVHEYAHGITNRLVGGADETTCLDTRVAAEQMGEGWSDFLALVATVAPEHTRDLARPFGTYPLGLAPADRGIRNHPYSTDLAVNPVTYASVADPAFSQPHGIGSVWASMLWDVYWDLVDAHGRSGDLLRGEGGDNRALALVMQALKLLPCYPDFVSGRDAILRADTLLYDGEDADLLWRAFARRGLGFGADAGERDDRFDGTESFALPPSPPPAPTYHLAKAVRENAFPSDTVAVSLLVVYRGDDSLAGATLVDTLPRGSRLVADGGGAIDPDGRTLAFAVPPLSPSDTFAVSYAYHVPATAPVSLRHERIRGADDVSAFRTDGLSGRGPAWFVDETLGFDDDASWGLYPPEGAFEAALTLGVDSAIAVEGVAPVLSFRQRRRPDTSGVAVLVEVGAGRNGGYSAVKPSAFLRGASSPPTQGEGSPGGAGPDATLTPDAWQHVVIDLAEFRGGQARLRWRVERVQGGTAGDLGGGALWSIDDVALLDAVYYDGEAVLVSSAGERLAAARPGGLGTFIDPPRESVDVATGSPAGDLSPAPPLSVVPNPATDRLRLTFAAEDEDRYVEIRDLRGANLRRVPVPSGRESAEVTLGALARGTYLACLPSRRGRTCARVIVR